MGRMVVPHVDALLGPLTDRIEAHRNDAGSQGPSRRPPGLYLDRGGSVKVAARAGAGGQTRSTWSC